MTAVPVCPDSNGAIHVSSSTAFGQAPKVALPTNRMQGLPDKLSQCLTLHLRRPVLVVIESTELRPVSCSSASLTITSTGLLRWRARHWLSLSGKPCILLTCLKSPLSLFAWFGSCNQYCCYIACNNPHTVTCSLQPGQWLPNLQV